MPKWIEIGDKLLNTHDIVYIYRTSNIIYVERINHDKDKYFPQTTTQKYLCKNSESAKNKYNEIRDILLYQETSQIVKLQKEIDDLRQMIIHLPQVGSVYQDAKNDFKQRSQTISTE